MEEHWPVSDEMGRYLAYKVSDVMIQVVLKLGQLLYH